MRVLTTNGLPFRDVGHGNVECKRCGTLVTIPPGTTRLESSHINGCYRFAFVDPESGRRLSSHGCLT